MKALRQPGQKTGLGGGQIDPGDADLGKSERPGPVPYPRNELTVIAAPHTGPIVESAGSNAAARAARPRGWQGVWRSEEQTAAFARRLAAQPPIGNAYLALQGELGAGKTTLVRHLLRALGVAGRVKSPSYAVVEPHQTPGLAIWHFDFYRFTDPREWEDAGLREIFAQSGLKIAEWPEKAAALAPVADLTIHIEIIDGGDGGDCGARRFSLHAQTATGRSLLAGVMGA